MTSARTPTFPQVIAASIEGALQRVHTQMPGRIESFDAANNVADVQPSIDQMVQQEDGTIVAVKFAVLRNVPVRFEGGGGFRATFPVAQGDYCEIRFQEASIDRWRSNGGVVDPQDGRRFHVSDAICVVGLQPNGSPWTGVATDAATFGKDGGSQVVVRKDKVELGADAANPPTEKAVLGSQQKSDLDTMLQNGATACTTAATACNTAVTALTTVTTAITAGAAGLAVTPLTPVGVMFGTLGTGLAALAAQLSAIGAQFTALGNAFTTMRTALPNHLSGTVLVK